MEDIKKLIYDARYFAAKKLYLEISQSTELDVISSLNSNKTMIDFLLERCENIQHTMEMTSTDNNDWLLVSDRLGVKTYYMMGADGLLWVRMEGSQHDVPLLEQLAVVKEANLYTQWVPFCSESKLIKAISENIDIFCF